jgi:hypothetical protein
MGVRVRQRAAQRHPQRERSAVVAHRSTARTAHTGAAAAAGRLRRV